MLLLKDLYLTSLDARRFESASGKKGWATLNIRVSDPERHDDGLLVVCSVTVGLTDTPEPDAEDIASLECSYTALVGFESDNEGESAEQLEAVSDYAYHALYPRIRERLMEITLRMGLPIFKLELLPPELIEVPDPPDTIDSE